MANIIKGDIVGYYHEYDLHIPSRTIFMGSLYVSDDGEESGTDSHMAERVIKNLQILENVSESGEDPITIVMNNPGGCWFSGMAIYNAIQACKNHVTIICYGQVMSMGSIIFQAADERIMSEDCDMMIHYGENGFFGNAKSFIKWAKHGERIDKRMERIYLDKIREVLPKFRTDKLRSLLSVDTILTPEEAIELGLADKILDKMKDI